MKKEYQLKKEHHYVWANYLLNWSNDRKNVWFKSTKGKLINDSVRMIAKERYFYQISHLNNEHELLIDLMSRKSEIRENHLQFLKHFLDYQKFEGIFKTNGGKNQEFDIAMEAHRHNTLENLHTSYENNAKFSIKSLTNRDLSFLQDTKESISFFHYLGQQFTRTKSFKDTTLLIMSKGKGNSEQERWISETTSECWWFISHMLGSNIGYALYESRKEQNHCLLINNTNQPFITSDNPVINVHQELTHDIKRPPQHDQFDLYYPITPNIAFMASSSHRFPNGTSILNSEIVHELNTKIATNSYKHIFSSTEEALKPYGKLVGNNYRKVDAFVKEHNKKA
ncbi:DUF4238 domain-containing protein [Aliivibrio sifiae]|uniref:DUF4238 domain-containing protein n=1 Tax=Aliivibrio sifiae TaxID=566293 RepID=A0A2S7XJC0_9GAMM|nr:DUF4238 domain-containing protein [Aliivibrio sifiae]PQJ93835.1 hypothetical protein BTO23_07035 [Aliivibrio sifiae]GLR75272.1 hypothetical protein GCM10007855_21460 [Aliivibrio sifiae]